MLYDLAEVNAHIVDLNRSRWNPDKSIRDKGIYAFDRDPEAKVYVKQSDYLDDAARPMYFFKFVDIEKLPWHRAKYGAEPLTINDPYWPEPMVPDAEGKYIIYDAILAKIANMEDYLDFRAENRDRGKTGHKESDRQFNADAKSAGVALTDQEIATVERTNTERQVSKH